MADAYEYKSIQAAGSKRAFYKRCYENFGWQQVENAGNGEDSGLYLRRHRKLMNRTELTRLQREFEACMEEIERLERSVSGYARGTAAALVAVILAGCLLMVTSGSPLFKLIIGLVLLNAVGWTLVYILYEHVKGRRTSEIMVFVEKKYREIEDLCNKGNALLQ